MDFSNLQIDVVRSIYLRTSRKCKTEASRKPVPLRAGINKRIGWHTFLHIFSTMLIANGEKVKVVQELMRHANYRCTLVDYSQVRIMAKRLAPQRVMRSIFPEEE